MKRVFRVAVLVASAFFGLASPVLAQSWDWVVNATNEAGNSLPAGSLAGYNISVVNNSSTPTPATVINIPFTSTPNPGIAVFSSATGTISGCTVGGPPATVSCTVPALAANEIANLTLRFTTNAAGVLTVIPNIPAGDANTDNNSQTVTTTITRGTDLSLVITGPATAQSGSRQNYSFTTTNLGPDVSDSFQVRFPVPTGLGAITAPPGCVLSGSNYLCTSSTPLAINASRSFVFSGAIGAGLGSSVAVTGSLQSQVPDDANQTNTNASLTTNVTTAGTDVAITKTRSPLGTVSVGTTVTFTLTPSYTGDVPNLPVIIDDLPANYTNIAVPSSSGWACTITGQRVRCTITPATGAGVNVPLGVVTITATASSAGNPANTAVISSTAPPPETNPPNNSASDGGVNITADTINLRINKVGPNPPTAVQGMNYIFNLSATNIGTVPYFGPLVIKEIVPVGMTVTSAGGTNFSCSPVASNANPVVGGTTITCTRTPEFTSTNPLGSLTSTAGINVNATITGTGLIGNRAEVNLPEPLTGPPIGNLRDSDLSNNAITYNLTSAAPADSADVRIIKTARFGTINAGAPQIFDVEIVNASPTVTSNVMTMRDELKDLINNTIGPNGGVVSFQVTRQGVASSPIACTGTFSGRSYNQVCTFDALPPCTQNVNCPIITTTIRPGWFGGTQTNTAIVTSAVTPDPNTANNVSTTSFTVTEFADMIVTKTATPASVRSGEELLYTITARNNQPGLTRAENVRVLDTLAANLTFVSAVPSVGTCTTPTPGTVTGTTSNNQITCDLLTMNVSTQQTVLVRVRPNQILRQTILSNTATVTSTTGDPDPANSSTVTTPVNDPSFDLLVGKTQSVNPVTVGDTMVYTLTVQNSGLSTAENVIVTDTLPGSLLSYQSISAVDFHAELTRVFHREVTHF